MATKHLFLFAAGCLALTACTSEDVVDDVSRNMITFENVVNKPSRAEDLTKTNLNHFNVFGFYTMQDNTEHAHEVFNNVPVSTNDGTTWTYPQDAARYWTPGNTYYFYAYSCGSVDLDKGISDKYATFMVDMETGEKDPKDRTLQIKNYICDNSHQHDLLFASYVDYLAGETNGPVEFKFQHILTKLSAKFTNSFQGEYDVVVREVTVSDICYKADYDFSTAVKTEGAAGWYDVKAGNPGEHPYVYLLDADRTDATDTPVRIWSQNRIGVSDADKKNLVGETNTAFVIPVNYTNHSEMSVKLNIKIDLMYGDDCVIKGKILKASLNPVWDQGHYYIYNIDLNASTISLNQIEFTVNDIKDWGTGEDVSGKLDKENNNN